MSSIHRFLDQAIEWFAANMKPEDVFSWEQLFNWAAYNGLAQRVEMDSAQDKVVQLRQDICRQWPTPTEVDAWAFLVTEVAEVGDCLLRRKRIYVRNNAKTPDIVGELGDVYLMLCTLATQLDVSLDDALECSIRKLRRKHSIDGMRRQQ